MIKIIAGRLKGRRVLTFNDKHYRPSQAKFKEGLFSILSSGNFALSNILKDAIVLDLFCGTGSLGFEALSRGAAHCTMVDSDSANLDLINKTAVQFGEQDNILTFKFDVTKLARTTKKYNLVFIDPPYFKNLVAHTLINLKTHNWLQSTAIIVVEIAKNEDLEAIAGYSILTERLYGKSKLIILSYNDE